MNNRSKIEATSVEPYEGHWTNSDFVITGRLTRKALTDPSIKPNFVVWLSNGERILVGWTDKQKQRLFFIKEFTSHATVSNRFNLKVVRMRGAIWRKTIKAVKRGMTKWFQGQDSYGINAFSQFTMPLIRQVYPQLIASDLVSVQPMAAPSSLIFYLNNKFGKP